MTPLGAIMYFCLWAPLNILRRIYWRWTVAGLEHVPPKGQGVVLAANHLNWLDIIVIGASLPLTRRPQWLGKAELFKNPMTAWWFRSMGVIPIRRGQRDANALNDAEEALRNGAMLIIFPEGHRSKTGGLLEGRGGAVRLAIGSKTPIMPTSLFGTERGFGGLMRRRPITVRFGPVYHPESSGGAIPSAVMDSLTTELMLQIAEQLPEDYRGVYRELQDQRMRRRSVGAPE